MMSDEERIITTCRDDSIVRFYDIELNLLRTETIPFNIMGLSVYQDNFIIIDSVGTTFLFYDMEFNLLRQMPIIGAGYGCNGDEINNIINITSGFNLWVYDLRGVLLETVISPVPMSGMTHYNNFYAICTNAPNEVRFLDNQYNIIRQEALGFQPRDITFLEEYFYISNPTNNSIDVFDIEFNHVNRTVVGYNPGGITSKR